MTASMMILILRAVVGHCLILHLVTSLGTACIIVFNYIVVYMHVFMLHMCIELIHFEPIVVHSLVHTVFV